MTASVTETNRMRELQDKVACLRAQVRNKLVNYSILHGKCDHDLVSTNKLRVSRTYKLSYITVGATKSFPPPQKNKSSIDPQIVTFLMHNIVKYLLW